MSKYLFLIIAILVLASCATKMKVVTPSWTPELFFKNAQEAMDIDRYKDALYYYDIFLVRYPEDRTRIIAVQYEKSFILYKRGKLKAAEKGYKAIIKEYEESPYATLFHPRFKTLSEIGLKRIEKDRATERKLFWRYHENKWAEEQGYLLIDEEGNSDT